MAEERSGNHGLNLYNVVVVFHFNIALVETKIGGSAPIADDPLVAGTCRESLLDLSSVRGGCIHWLWGLPGPTIMSLRCSVRASPAPVTQLLAELPKAAEVAG